MADEAEKILLGDTAISAGGEPPRPGRRFFRRKKEVKPPLIHCENCGTLLAGRWCSQCGQPAVDYRRSFRHVVVDVLDSFLNWDSKFLATLGHLISRPWKLTNEFLAGHRVRYLNPLRLYLLASVLFFFVMNYLERQAERAGARPIIFDEPGQIQPREPKPDATPPIDRPGDPDVDDEASTEEDSKNDKDLGPFIIGSDPNRERTSFELWLNQRIEEKIGRRGDKAQFFLRSLMQNLPYMMLACIPLFAFVLKLLYIFRRIFYIDHLIYALHIHSFAYSAVLLIIGISSLLGRTLSGLVPFTIFVLISTSVILVFISIRKVYRQNWFVSLFKFWLGGVAYFVVLLLALAATLFATLAVP